jgi:hypothetical protein
MNAVGRWFWLVSYKLIFLHCVKQSCGSGSGSGSINSEWRTRIRFPILTILITDFKNKI